jgi:hypothetical protein
VGCRLWSPIIYPALYSQLQALFRHIGVFGIFILRYSVEKANKTSANKDKITTHHRIVWLDPTRQSEHATIACSRIHLNLTTADFPPTAISARPYTSYRKVVFLNLKSGEAIFLYFRAEIINSYDWRYPWYSVFCTLFQHLLNAIQCFPACLTLLHGDANACMSHCLIR